MLPIIAECKRNGHNDDNPHVMESENNYKVKDFLKKWYQHHGCVVSTSAKSEVGRIKLTAFWERSF